MCLSTKLFRQSIGRHQHSTLGRRTFSVAGLIVWNSLPDELQDDIEDSCFRQLLKTLLFSQYYCAQRIIGVLVHDNALYKSTFYLLTYLLTYLFRVYLLLSFPRDHVAYNVRL